MQKEELSPGIQPALSCGVDVAAEAPLGVESRCGKQEP